VARLLICVELSSDDEIDDGNLGNGESKAGFISRRPSMTAELETRIRQVRLSEGSDLDRHSGPNSPSASTKWGLYGMNWNSPNPILSGGGPNTDRATPPQDQAQPLSPLARFQQSPFDPPAPRQVSPANASSQAYGRSRFPPPTSQQLDSSQRVQRSQSFSVGDGSTFGNAAAAFQPPVGGSHRLFPEDPTLGSGPSRHFKTAASQLSHPPIAEEQDDYHDHTSFQPDSKEGSPSRYADRGRSLSTSAASHGFQRQKLEGDPEGGIEEALYEEDEDAAQEFEPLSRSRTLPSDPHGVVPGLSFVGGVARFPPPGGRGGPRQSPRIVEDIPSTSRRQDSFSQASSAWDDSRGLRSPGRSSDFPPSASGNSVYDTYDSSRVESPGSLHSFPPPTSTGREYPHTQDVQNYFNNDQDRRRMAAEQFQIYQMQNRYQRYPYAGGPSGTTVGGPHDYPSRTAGAFPFQDTDQYSLPFQNPDQYTLHFVKFKANRMDVFYLDKEKKLDLKVKDYVIVDGDRGTDLGMVSQVDVSEEEAKALVAQLAREQAAATAANQNGMNANAMEAIIAAANQVNERDIKIPKKSIHRLANKGEIDGLQMKMQDEAQAKQVCEMKVQQRGLQMDILDVEYQWYVSPLFPLSFLSVFVVPNISFRDRRKLFIYFIAPQRVDFVALVKDLFKIYKTRIWLHNSTAAHVTSQFASQQGLLPSTQQLPGQQPDLHDYPSSTHLQPQYDYYRSQATRQSPGQQQYLPAMPQHQPMYGGGGYYSPHQQSYYPPLPPTAGRGYQPIPPPPAHMPHYSSSGAPPPPSGHW